MIRIIINHPTYLRRISMKKFDVKKVASSCLALGLLCAAPALSASTSGLLAGGSCGAGCKGRNNNAGSYRNTISSVDADEVTKEAATTGVTGSAGATGGSCAAKNNTSNGNGCAGKNNTSNGGSCHTRNNNSNGSGCNSSSGCKGHLSVNAKNEVNQAKRLSLI